MLVEPDEVEGEAHAERVDGARALQEQALVRAHRPHVSQTP
jgi:hypothetical protein